MQSISEMLNEKQKEWIPPKVEKRYCPHCGSLMNAIKHEFLYGRIKYRYEYVCPNDCENKLKLKEQRIAEYKKRYKKAKRAWSDANLSRECVGWTLDNMTCENIEILRQYARDFNRFSKALVLQGYKGTGKSLASECIVKHLLKNGFKAKITNMTELNMQMNKALIKDDYDNFMQKILTYDLIVVDDFGRETYTTEKSQENAFQLINLLSKEHKPFIISVNPEMLAILAKKPSFDAILDRFRDTKRVKILKFHNKVSFRK